MTIGFCHTELDAGIHRNMATLLWTPVSSTGVTKKEMAGMTIPLLTSPHAGEE